MHDFQYVTKKELRPFREQLVKLIRLVQREVRGHFTFQYRFIGSVARNMVTYDRKSNVGFDFDVNLIINNKKNYPPKQIRDILRYAFDKFVKKYNYDFSEDSTRVLTIKVKDIKHSKILHSCDLAIVNKKEDKYIRFDKEHNQYVWAKQPKEFNQLPDKIEFCKSHGLWLKVRDLYIDKKNANTDSNLKSRSIFAKTVNEICLKHGYKKNKRG